MDTVDVILYTLTLILTALFLHATLRIPHKLNKNRHPPPSPPSLPFVGHLHLIKDPLHRTLESLSRRYGPVFHLRLGSLPVLVISSPKAAEECFSKNDIVFASRPRVAVGEIMGYNYTMPPLAMYDDLWRNLRRVMTLEALSSNRIQQSAWMRQEEVRFIVQEYLIVSGSGKVNLHDVLSRLTKNAMMRMVAGMRWPTNGSDWGLLVASKPINLCDMFPILKWMGFFKGTDKQLRGLRLRRDRFLDSLLEKARKGREEEVGKSKTTSLVEELLALQKEEPDYFTEEILKGILLTMLSGGTDTTSRTMEWAMSLLLNHPTTFQKTRSEIDSNVGTTRLVNDSDLSNLPFLRCVLNETLRLFPVFPLLLPHCASQDTTVGGYHVDKGTILLVNAWALHRDPAVWEDPNACKPERFEGVEGGVGYRFIPFGMGRRACPGLNLGMRMMMLTVATLVQCFEWESTEGGVVDMEEVGGGLPIGKTQHLLAVCRPRACMMDILSQL